MRLVAIIGSPHGMKGNTAVLLDGVMRGARAAGAEVTLVSLAEYTVQPCNGCEACHITGVCPIRDDFTTIKDAMLAADGVVLASPNYIISVSAQVKALLDRCSGPIHTQAFEGKYAAAVVTSGGGNSEEVEAYMLRALRMMGFTSVGSAGALAWQLLREETRIPLLNAAEALGYALVEAIRAKQAFPDQDEEHRQIRERMQTLVTMRKDHWPFEYEYWMAKTGR
ncbi:MAG: NAD(P)H dehydrogenase (quinone) [bacterium ADurb.Bin429]|nr:MAG: NAD(P)H dehydrogenase (quinone) [bacterium ADurb.Bin429]